MSIVPVAATKPAVVTTGSIPGSSAKLVSATPKRRLILSIEGLEKQGKTHFALTAPGPIAIQNIDMGLEGVVNKFNADKEIHEANYRMEFPFSQASAQGAVAQFIADYKAFLGSDKIRTIIHDTSTEFWDLMRIARLGKLVQVMPHNYVQVNAEFREIGRLAYDSDCNLILLHKMKKEYVNEQATGKYQRAGFSDIGFLVQVTAQAFRDKEHGFSLRIINCRQNPAVEGAILAGDKCSFLGLALTIFPESSPEEWTQ